MPSLSTILFFFQVLEELADMRMQGPDNKQMNTFNLWARWAVWKSHVRLCDV